MFTNLIPDIMLLMGTKLLVILIGCLGVGNLNLLMLEVYLEALSLVGIAETWLIPIVGHLYQIWGWPRTPRNWGWRLKWSMFMGLTMIGLPSGIIFLAGRGCMMIILSQETI